MLQYAIICKVLPGSPGERETKEERALLVLKEFTGALIPTLGWGPKPPGELPKHSYWISASRVAAPVCVHFNSQAKQMVSHDRQPPCRKVWMRNFLASLFASPSIYPLHLKTLFKFPIIWEALLLLKLYGGSSSPPKWSGIKTPIPPFFLFVFISSPYFSLIFQPQGILACALRFSSLCLGLCFIAPVTWCFVSSFI